jgi:hypothetical protein
MTTMYTYLDTFGSPNNYVNWSTPYQLNFLYTNLYIIMAIFKEFMHCVNTPFHSQILHLFQFADEMSDSHIYKYSQNNLGGGREGREDQYYKKKSPNIAFHFFYNHKINLHLGISIFVQLFFLCFLKYESFSILSAIIL